MAKLLADNDDTDVNRIVCTLNDPATNQLDRMDLRLGPTGFTNVEFGNISLVGAVTLSSPGTVTVNCIETEAPSPAVTVSLRKLIAIKVDTLHP